MRVLGIDPSIRSTGFGVIEYAENECSAIGYGIIKPSRNLPFHQKLNEIRRNVEDIISAYNPSEVALENPFYAQNIKTAIALGQVRGAILVAVASRNCSLFEYSPLEIKKAVTGYGQADKNQVLAMVKNILHIDDEKMETDASDALATAVCHLHSRMFQQKIEEDDCEEKE